MFSELCGKLTFISSRYHTLYVIKNCDYELIASNIIHYSPKTMVCFLQQLKEALVSISVFRYVVCLVA